MSRRVLKWVVPVDNHDHPIGSGAAVVLVAVQHPDPDGAIGVVTVWTDEPDAENVTVRSARVYGTGQSVPEDDLHVGSCLDGPLVWHVFASRRLPITVREVPNV